MDNKYTFSGGKATSYQPSQKFKLRSRNMPLLNKLYNKKRMSS